MISQIESPFELLDPESEASMGLGELLAILAEDWTQILYQLGIGIAGIKSAVR